MWCLQDLRATTADHSAAQAKRHRQLADSVDARFALMQDTQLQATRAHQDAVVKLAESLGEEHSTLEAGLGEVQHELTSVTTQLADEMTRLHLKGESACSNAA